MKKAPKTLVKKPPKGKKAMGTMEMASDGMSPPPMPMSVPKGKAMMGGMMSGPMQAPTFGKYGKVSKKRF